MCSKKFRKKGQSTSNILALLKMLGSVIFLLTAPCSFEKLQSKRTKFQNGLSTFPHSAAAVWGGRNLGQDLGELLGQQAQVNTTHHPLLLQLPS